MIRTDRQETNFKRNIKMKQYGKFVRLALARKINKNQQN